MLSPIINPTIQIAMTTRDDFVDTDLLDRYRSQDDRIRAKHSGLAKLGRTSDQTAFCNQIHTDIIHHATHPGLQWDGDAMITDTRGTILQISVADCTPVIVVGNRSDWSPIAAAIHSGRWPTAKNIVGQTVYVMIDTYDVEDDSMSARIGPSASRGAYEFGPEAYDLFDTKYIHQQWEKLYLGVADCVYDQLIAAGVSKIQRDRSCTITDTERFFSYRRDGQTGQNMCVRVCFNQ